METALVNVERGQNELIRYLNRISSNRCSFPMLILDGLIVHEYRGFQTGTYTLALHVHASKQQSIFNMQLHPR